MRTTLFELADGSGCNPCGEGGEYETLVIDCPLFKRHIVLDECSIGGDEVENPIAPVGHLMVLSYHTEAKSADELDALQRFALRSRSQSAMQDGSRDDDAEDGGTRDETGGGQSGDDGNKK